MEEIRYLLSQRHASPVSITDFTEAQLLMDPAQDRQVEEAQDKYLCFMYN